MRQRSIPWHFLQKERLPITCIPSIHCNNLRKQKRVIKMATGIVTLSDSTFDEIVGSATTPILVDFWAEWCGPCKMIAPVLEEIATEQAGRVTIAKLNIDEHPDAAQRFGVMSIPTLLLFKDGELAHRMVGAKGKMQMMADLDPHL